MTQFLKRSAFILLATSALGACAPMAPNFPIARETAAAAPPSAPVVREEPQPEAPPAPSVVESRTLEPPPARAPEQGYAPPPSYAPPPAPAYTPPPAPTYKTITKRTVTGKVVEVVGRPRTYEVKKGDNLERVARKLDTDVEQLAKDNKLKKPFIIQPGDTLKGPKSTAKAYVVGQGDTVFSIAKRFSVTADALRDENDLARNASIRSGQKIRLPGGYRDKGPLTVSTRVAVEAPAAPTPVAMPPRPSYAPPPTTTTTTTVTTTPPTVQPPSSAAAPRPYTPPAPRPYTPPPATTTTTVTTTTRSTPPAAPVSAPPASDAQISQLGRGRFIWPARGEVLSGFGPKAMGQRNDGLNIRAATGDPVRAAASGDVVYAGDQVPGFGNLVLIKHADGWVTAYGHLSRVDVKMQQKVTQGQQIGQAGSTGGAAEPQLHFEVRYAPSPLERARPVDPSLVLPR